MNARPSRRGFLGLAGAAAAGAGLAACSRNTNVNPLQWEPLPTLAPTPTMRAPEKLDGDDALARLLEGNQRFVDARLAHPDQAPERRTAVAGGQAPFAIVLGCADSRVPPEILFDQGLGDLFVVRVAGNVLSETILASLEYAAEHLGAPLALVLGHQRCGAVKAALETVDGGGAAPGHIASLVTALKPAVEAAREAPAGEDELDWAVRMNVLQVTQQLPRRSALLGELMKRRRLKIAGGYYDLDTGVVEIIA
jgi:carbonic anhydrase